MRLQGNRTSEQMEGWLLKINELVATDFAFDMDCKLGLPDQKEFSQEEARHMAHLIGDVYRYAHRISCDACQHNATLLIPADQPPMIGEPAHPTGEGAE